MVELRKRPPPKEPLAPAPAAKRGKAAGATSKAKPKETVATKAKNAAAKVKDAIAGPFATDDVSKQSAVEDEAVVEAGEAGLIPETAGTAPSTITVPGSNDVPVTSTSTTEADSLPAQTTSGIDAPLPAEPTAGAEQGDAKIPPHQTTVRSRTANKNAEAPAPADSTTPQAEPAAAAESSTDDRPPATADLENPPETGNVEPASAASHATESATLPLSAASIGKSIPNLPTFGGPIETHTGEKTSVATLLATHGGGIIIFTYPRASTPGCTTQACAFRDAYAEFTTSSGYAVFGLSTDSVKANTTFATKQRLQYPLLCDVNASLTGAIGMKKPGNAKGTLRGVVVVDGAGVVKVWFQGGPQRTVDVVREFLATVK